MAEGGRTTDPLDETSTWPAVAPPADPISEPVAPEAPDPATPPASTATGGGSGWSTTPPSEGTVWRPGRTTPRPHDDHGGRILGLILIVVGVWLLLRRYVDIDTQLVLPIVAIAVGGVLLASGLRPRGRNG